jgi:hypothetical protein
VAAVLDARGDGVLGVADADHHVDDRPGLAGLDAAGADLDDVLDGSGAVSAASRASMLVRVAPVSDFASTDFRAFVPTTTTSSM